MSLFKKKPIYSHKVMQKYNINIAKVNEAFERANAQLRDYDEQEFCKLVGETNRYNIYIYKQKVNGCGGYLLRQEKALPRKVVYMGQACDKLCVFHEKIYMINRISRIGQVYHPLFCLDIQDGTKRELDLLSHKECFMIFSDLHIHCQDFVEDITVEGGSIVMDVTRYKEKANYEKEMSYTIQLHDLNGTIVPQRFYPEEEEM